MPRRNAAVKGIGFPDFAARASLRGTLVVDWWVVRGGEIIHRAAVAAIAAWGIAVVSGCAAQRPARVAASESGGSPRWEIVLPGGPVSDAGVPESVVSSVAFRRDEALAVRDNAHLTAIDTWPEDLRPTLERPRRLFITPRETTYLYFGVRREYRRDIWPFWY